MLDAEQEWLRGSSSKAYDKFKRMIDSFGLGKGFVASEMLRPDDIREAIINFKKVENIRELVVQAGYKGEEIDRIVKYIVNCQKSLGSDIDIIWKILTGETVVIYDNFSELDNILPLHNISSTLNRNI